MAKVVMQEYPLKKEIVVKIEDRLQGSSRLQFFSIWYNSARNDETNAMNGSAGIIEEGLGCTARGRKVAYH